MTKQQYSVTKSHTYAGSALLISIGLVMLLASIALVIYWDIHQSERPQQPKRIVLPYVQTVPVKLSDNKVRVNAGGFVVAKTTADISAQVSGKVLRVSPNLLVGKTVKKGEVLVQLGTTDYRAALTSAKANLITAQATVHSRQASLASAKSAYEQAQGQSRQAARDIKNLGIKATRLNLKKPQLAAAKANVDMAEANLQSAQAAIDNAKAQLQLAETNLNRTTITAPFTAKVLASNIAIGEIVNNAVIIAKLAATDVYTVKLTLDRKATRWVSLGDKVRLVDTIYNKAYDAELSRLSAGVDEKNRTIAAYVDIVNPVLNEPFLLLNSYLQATVDGAVISNSAIIPNSAIVNNAYVWGKSQNDSIVELPIQIIQRGSKTTVVTFEELNVSEIITHPKEGFIAGQKVTTQRKPMQSLANDEDKKTPQKITNKTTERKVNSQSSVTD